MTKSGTIPLSEIERIEIWQNTRRFDETELADVAKETGGDIVFNGTIYLEKKYIPVMPCKADGTVLFDPGYTIWGLAWDEPETFRESVVPCDAANYISCTNLIHQGEKVDKPNYQPDMGGKRPRTAIGVKEGRFAYFVTQDGYTPEALRDLLHSYGWSGAIMLDGGGSTCFRDQDGTGFIGDQDRAVQHFIVIHLKKEETDMSVKTYSKAKSGSVKLSANFSVSEFACHDGSDTVLISDELVALLQKIRDHFGKAITINSGYRTVAWNAKNGGAPKSQHLLGKAADITISGVTPLAVAQYAEFLQPAVGGIGLYQSFTHVDVRTARTRWDSRSGTEKAVSGWPGYTEPTDLEKAVDKLVAAKIIDSPDYWKAGSYSAETVRLLLIKMAETV